MSDDGCARSRLGRMTMFQPRRAEQLLVAEWLRRRGACADDPHHSATLRGETSRDSSIARTFLTAVSCPLERANRTVPHPTASRVPVRTRRRVGADHVHRCLLCDPYGANGNVMNHLPPSEGRPCSLVCQSRGLVQALQQQQAGPSSSEVDDVTVPSSTESSSSDRRTGRPAARANVSTSTTLSTQQPCRPVRTRTAAACV